VFQYVGVILICVKSAKLDTSEHYKTLKYKRCKGMSKDNNITDTCNTFNEPCDEVLQQEEKSEIRLQLKNKSSFCLYQK